jgi:hypothetical protein
MASSPIFFRKNMNWVKGNNEKRNTIIVFNSFNALPKEMVIKKVYVPLAFLQKHWSKLSRHFMG